MGGKKRKETPAGTRIRVLKQKLASKLFGPVPVFFSREKNAIRAHGTDTRDTRHQARSAPILA